MTRINPEIAKRLRERLNLSLEAVQDRSRINKSTIHRIEAGKSKSSRRHVIARLATALNTTPEILTGESAQGADEMDDGPLFKRSLLSVRIPDEIRNALALVAMRYSIQPLDIVEIAPLLFYIVAEESLRDREEKLAALRGARKELESLGPNFTHITERLVSDWEAGELETAEERSISLRDLRGAILDEHSGCDPRPLDYEPDVENPLVAHLRKRLERLGGKGQLTYWHEALSPRYEICFDEALAYSGGDEDCAYALIYGLVGMHEIPKELIPFERVARRNAWIAERRKAHVQGLDGLTLPLGDQP